MRGPALYPPRHGGAPPWAPPTPVKSSKGLAITLSILVPGAVVVGILQGLLQPTEFTSDGATVMAHRDGWGALTVPLGIAGIVVGVIWSYRVTANARAVGDPKTPSPGWMVGSWFIPVAHIILPLFPLMTAWKKSKAGSLGILFGCWIPWALYLAGLYVATVWGMVVGFGAGMEAAGPGDPVTVVMPANLVVFTWVIQGLHVIAGAFFLAVVWRFHGAQQRMGAWLARKGRQAPPAAPFGGAVPPWAGRG